MAVSDAEAANNDDNGRIPHAHQEDNAALQSIINTEVAAAAADSPNPVVNDAFGDLNTEGLAIDARLRS